MARELLLALLPRHFPTLPKGAFNGDSAVRCCSMDQPTHSVGGDFLHGLPALRHGGRCFYGRRHGPRALQASDLILFFTDGLFDVENANDESFNEQRLRESIHTRAGMAPAELVQDVFSEIEQFTAGRAFADDVCFLGMEIAHLPSSNAA